MTTQNKAMDWPRIPRPATWANQHMRKAFSISPIKTSKNPFFPKDLPAFLAPGLPLPN